MTLPTMAVLNPSTLNRKWWLQVNTGTTGTPTWVTVEGVTDFAPVLDGANFVDDTDQAGQGYQSQLKASASWSATCSVRRATVVGTPKLEPPGQAFLKTKSVGVIGPANTISVRFFDYDPNDVAGTYTPRTEAYTGSCGVGWADQGGGMDAPSRAQVTLTGQGKLLSITHPYPAT